MVLPYKIWTEEDIKNRNVSPEGEYPFKIINAVLKQTKGGLDEKGHPKDVYPMLELDLEYHDTNGIVKRQRDWIVFMEKMDWKLRHLAKTIGQLELYENKLLEERNLQNKLGVMLLGIKDSEYKGEIQKQNFVKDYIVREQKSITNDFIDDEIKF